MKITVTLDFRSLKALIKESVREVLQEEWFSLWETVIPVVSDAEQADIDRSSGQPQDYQKDEFVDMTDWLFDSVAIESAGC